MPEAKPWFLPPTEAEEMGFFVLHRGSDPSLRYGCRHFHYSAICFYVFFFTLKPFCVNSLSPPLVLCHRSSVYQNESCRPPEGSKKKMSQLQMWWSNCNHKFIINRLNHCHVSQSLRHWFGFIMGLLRTHRFNDTHIWFSSTSWTWQNANVILNYCHDLGGAWFIRRRLDW
jgi:hypothetical protein